jgi:hypothetical protein
MKHLDFTIDFETCSLSSDAAIMQVAVVPWLRDADVEPFMSKADAEPFVNYVDLRSCVVEGMDFDPATVSWWSRQSDDAKRAVCRDLPEPIADVLVGALDFIRSMVKEHSLDSICLWAHGMDVDCAILRSLCRRFDIDLESIIPHTQLRDCRTVILEAAYKLACQQRLEAIATAETLLSDGTPVPYPAVSQQEVLSGSRKAYDLFPPLPSQYDGCLHDALYDALRSTWYTYQALKTLRQ